MAITWNNLPQNPPGQGPDDTPFTPYNFGDQRPVTPTPYSFPSGAVPPLGTVTGPPWTLPTYEPDYIANHPNTNKPTPTGNISFTFGGGGGGGGASVPSNVLTPRQFPPYESTYTPPAAVTPEPYNWATRDPYTYGEGLSNAGAAYDIWGSAPGTNPYLMTVPSNYTPGLLGMPPVQLPANVPSTNVSANLNPGNPPPPPPKRFDPFNETMGVQQSVYEAAMDKIYADTVIDAAGNKGYTGQDAQGRRPDLNDPNYTPWVSGTPIEVAPPYYPPKAQSQGNVPGTPIKSFETKKQEARDSIQTAAAKAGGNFGTARNYGVTGKRIVGGR